MFASVTSILDGLDLNIEIEDAVPEIATHEPSYAAVSDYDSVITTQTFEEADIDVPLFFPRSKQSATFGAKSLLELPCEDEPFRRTQTL